MKLRLQSYPPLGQVTAANADEGLRLQAVLEVPQHWENAPWQIILWYSVDKKPWIGTELSNTVARHAPCFLQRGSSTLCRVNFETHVNFESSLQFTFKLRHSEDEEWIWAHDQFGLNDGYVTNVMGGVAAPELKELIPNLNKEWVASELQSQAPQTRLWSLKVSVPAAENDISSFRDINVGTPWGSFLRWFALVRHNPTWMGPRKGGNQISLDKDAILCSFLGPSGRHLVLLTMSGPNSVTSLFRQSEGNSISVHARNDGTSHSDAVILISEGADFERAVAAVMYQARRLMEPFASALPILQKYKDQSLQDIKPQWMESWYDGLGYCTWNSLGPELSETKILDALAKFKEHQIPISSLIIDDNWQSIDRGLPGRPRGAWARFEADPNGFPKGLAASIYNIREHFPELGHVSVWHAMLGYWGGISPQGEIAKTYQTIELSQDDGTQITVISQEDVARFYNEFYKFLLDCGLDGVKTDAQVMMDKWTSADARRKLTNEYFDSWIISSLRHFDGQTISCMSQFPQALFYSQMPRNRYPMVVRNSDDYFPDIPSSHAWHIWANAHNSIFTQYLNSIPDWDMFQTDHAYAGFHAAARCVSGGPIYITDTPGQHNLSLINEITGKKPLGGSVILRPSVVGKSICPYIGYEDNAILKIASYHGSAATGTSIIGVFNVSNKPIIELMPFSDFSGAVSHISYVVRSHSSGKISQPMRRDEGNPTIAVSLEVQGYDILSAYPLSVIPSRRFRYITIANLGLLGKMTGCAAILSSTITELKRGRVTLSTQLKTLGILGIYISELPQLSITDDFMITHQGYPIRRESVWISKIDERVLEIDVEKVWNGTAMPKGWSNEVEITVSFSI